MCKDSPVYASLTPSKFLLSLLNLQLAHRSQTPGFPGCAACIECDNQDPTFLQKNCIGLVERYGHLSPEETLLA